MVTEITTAAAPRRLPTVARVVLGARAMAGSMLMPSYTCIDVGVNVNIDNSRMWHAMRDDHLSPARCAARGPTVMAVIPLTPHHAMRLANAVGNAFPGLPGRGAPLASVVVMVATRGPARPPQGRGLGGH